MASTFGRCADHALVKLKALLAPFFAAFTPTAGVPIAGTWHPSSMSWQAEDAAAGPQTVHAVHAAKRLEAVDKFLRPSVSSIGESC